MSTAQTNFEKYLAREPLTPELADLRDGLRTIASDPDLLLGAITEARGGLPTEADDKPLSKDERQALREGRQVGAVTTLIRLLRKQLRTRIRKATIDSENDPLARSQEIAQTWAYITVYRQVMAEIEAAITREIEELEKEERGHQ